MMTIIVNKADGMKMCKELALQGYYNKLKPVAGLTYELTTKAPREVVNALRNNKNIELGGLYLWSK